jgi:hypothetical protein
MYLSVICNKDKEMDWEKLTHVSDIYIDNQTIE